MAATIKIKNSSTAGAVPTSGQLVQGELAVNVTDRRIFTENAAGTVVELGTPSIDDNGNATAITIDSSENVSIGLTSAHGRFSVKNASDPAGVNVVAGLTTYRAANDSRLSMGYCSTPDAFVIGATYDTTGAFKPLVLATSDTERVRITSSGEVIVGGSTSTFAQSGVVTVMGTSGGTAGGGGFLNLYRADTSVSSGNSLGTVSFYGDDTTSNTPTEFASVAAIASGTHAAGDNPTDLVFSTTADNSATVTERVRIDASGNLLVGTTTVGGNGGITLAPNADDGAGRITFDRATTTASSIAIVFENANATSGQISYTNTATTYSTSSDYRLKDVTGSLTGYKERLSALQPKQGSWKVDGSEFRGFLAHEFAESYPSSVSGEKDAVDSDGNPQHQGMQAGSPEVIADLVAYVKELETRLAALEA